MCVVVSQSCVDNKLEKKRTNKLKPMHAINAFSSSLSIKTYDYLLHANYLRPTLDCLKVWALIVSSAS